MWDYPGLQDGTDKDDEYLVDMEKNCKDVDLYVYCISALDRRFTKDYRDTVCMKKLIKVFGSAMWEHTLFVLTFANVLENVDDKLREAEDVEKPSIFKEILEERERELKSRLEKDVGVSKEKIHFVPAGYPRKPMLLD